MAELPVASSAAAVPSWAFTATGAVFFLLSTAWAVRESRRTASPTPLLALGGGFTAALEEAWIDTLIQLWYPRDSPIVVFTALDHSQPLYVFLVYPGFVGLGSYLAYRAICGDRARRNVWRMFGGIVLLDMAFEIPATVTGVFGYYGQQPLQPVTDAWPMWVAFINAAGPVLAGWLVYLLAQLLTAAQHRLAVLLLPPMAYAATFGATGWPTFSLLKTDVPAGARWAAATATIALCLAMVAAIAAMANHMRGGGGVPQSRVDADNQRDPAAATPPTPQS